MAHQADGSKDRLRYGRCAVVQRRSGPRSMVINMKILDVPQSGTRGTTVSYKSRYGQITRQRVVPRDPRTAVQVSRREAFGRARFLWGTLTEQQRIDWNRVADGSRTRRHLNQSGPLSGYLLFMKINCNQAAVGLEMLLDPPGTPQFDPSPVGELKITNSGGVIALKLGVSGKPVRYTVVYGSKPRSAGTTYVDHFTILGMLADPVRGVCDITDLYLGKYAVLPVGSRIFIQTVQQIDGWQDTPRRTSAIVPAG
jgi:hypothetical protein